MANHRGVAGKIARADKTGGSMGVPSKCGACGYGLEGLVVLRCPECGQLLDDRRTVNEELAITIRQRVQYGICSVSFLVLAYFGACMFGLVPSSWTLVFLKSFAFTGSQYVGLLVVGVLVGISCVYMLPVIRGRHTPRTKRACEWLREDYVD